MATNPYDKYLKRLRGRINQNPYMQNARRTAFATTPDKFGDDRFSDAPIGVQAQHDLDRAKVSKEITTDVVERAGVRDIERKTDTAGRIDELKFKSDQYEEGKKDKFWDNVLEVGGAVIGGAIGTFTPVGTLGGAQLGASAGQLLGGFTGDNSEDIGAGLASGIQTFTQISSDKKMIELGNMGGEAYKILSGLGETEGSEFIFQWKNAKTIEQKRILLDKYLGTSRGVLA